MPRLLFPSAAVLTVTLMAVIVLIRLQPYDDRGLDAALHPTNCQMPCFLGIQPGATDAETAESRLAEHDWIAYFDRYPIGEARTEGFSDTYRVYFTETRPSFLRLDDPALLMPGNWILTTHARISDVHLTLGEPSLVFISYVVGFHQVQIRALYPDQSVRVTARFRCPQTLRNYLEAPVETLELMDTRYLRTQRFQPWTGEFTNPIC